MVLRVWMFVNKQQNKIRSTANRNLGFLQRNISSCSRTTKARAFNSLVRPHLEYSCTLWDPYTQEQITQLDKVQHRGARFVFNDYDYTSSPAKMISKLKWESLQVRRMERRLLVLHQALHGHLSIPANNILRPTTRPSRFTNDCTFQRIQTKKYCYKNSYFPQTIVDWNSLPYNIIATTKKESFKAKLHKHLYPIVHSQPCPVLFYRLQLSCRLGVLGSISVQIKDKKLGIRRMPSSWNLDFRQKFWASKKKLFLMISVVIDGNIIFSNVYYLNYSICMQSLGIFGGVKICKWAMYFTPKAGLQL